MFTITSNNLQYLPSPDVVATGHITKVETITLPTTNIAPKNGGFQ